MIIIKTENYNFISQDFYNKTMILLILTLFPVSAVIPAVSSVMAFTDRKIQLTDRILSLSVVRVYCKVCRHTHALFLSSMVPYSQIPLVLHVHLIHVYGHDTGFQNILAEQYCMVNILVRWVLPQLSIFVFPHISKFCL